MQRDNVYSKENTEILVENLKVNCQKSQRLFVKNYSGIIHRIVLAKVKNTTDATTLFNECLFKVFLNIGKYDQSKGMLSTWVAKLCTNLCIDYNRTLCKKKDLRVYLLEDIFPGYSEDVLGNIEDSNEVDLGAKVLKMMETLNPREIEILQMKYFEDKSFDEICERLNIRNQNARTIAFRAKEKLKASLHDTSLID
jgi:RNA polymerase sigma-70 factor (ECF subfamily)